MAEAVFPQVTPESAPFWEACRHESFLLPACRSCHARWFPPSGVCPECWHAEWDWLPASGRGRIYSFVTYRRAYHPAFRDRIPYVVAVIELEEGPHMASMLVDCPEGAVHIGDPVTVQFVPISEEYTLPLFAMGGKRPE